MLRVSGSVNLWFGCLRVVRFKEQRKFDGYAALLCKRKAPFANCFDDASAYSAVTELVLGDFRFTNPPPMGDLKAYIYGAF